MAELSAELREQIRGFLKSEANHQEVELRAYDARIREEINSYLESRGQSEVEKRDKFTNRILSILGFSLATLAGILSAAFYFFTNSVRIEANATATLAVKEALLTDDVVNARAEILASQKLAALFDQSAGELLSILKSKSEEWNKLTPDIAAIQAVLASGQGLADLKITLANDEVFRSQVAANAQGLSLGIVVASLEPCSNLSGSWQNFEEGAGRFLIGANAGQQPSLGVRQLLSVGGEETVTLTEAQMPSHSHGVKRQTDEDSQTTMRFWHEARPIVWLMLKRAE